MDAGGGGAQALFDDASADNARRDISARLRSARRMRASSGLPAARLAWQQGRDDTSFPHSNFRVRLGLAAAAGEAAMPELELANHAGDRPGDRARLPTTIRGRRRVS